MSYDILQAGKNKSLIRIMYVLFDIPTFICVF